MRAAARHARARTHEADAGEPLGDRAFIRRSVPLSIADNAALVAYAKQHDRPVAKVMRDLIREAVGRKA